MALDPTGFIAHVDRSIHGFGQTPEVAVGMARAENGDDYDLVVSPASMELMRVLYLSECRFYAERTSQVHFDWLLRANGIACTRAELERRSVPSPPPPAEALITARRAFIIATDDWTCADYPGLGSEEFATLAVATHKLAALDQLFKANVPKSSTLAFRLFALARADSFENMEES